MNSQGVKLLQEPLKRWLIATERIQATDFIGREALAETIADRRPTVSMDRPIMMNAIFILLTLAIFIQAGVESASSKDPPRSNSGDNGYELYADHVVEFDSDGNLKFGASPEKFFSKIARQRRKRIVLYIHGGRVTLERARKTASQLTVVIQQSDPDAYPIFLNWEAGQGTSYFRHVAYERNGISYRESSSAPIVAVASPIVFFSDIGRGVSRLPINTLLSVGKLLQNWDTIVGRHDHFFAVKGKFDQRLQDLEKLKLSGGKPISEIYKEGFVYAAALHDSKRLSVSMGHDAHVGKVNFAAGYVATLPLQFGTEPILDTFGTPAWSNMVRRTRSMFHPQGNYISERHGSTSWRIGGAAIFFNALSRFMNERSRDGFTLDIYAHSMGTMIMNEAFTERPDLHVDHLVYMAAACSIRDFQNSAGRYIENHHTPFYNLSLHPRAELDEVEVSGIPVRGSLLVWIDEFFGHPQSFGDRTLGSFENAIIAQDLLPHGSNVHLKSFPMEDGAHMKQQLFAGPQKHNDFAKYYFWKPEFYNTDDANRYYPRIDQATDTEQLVANTKVH